MEFLKTLAEATTQLDAGWRNELGFPSIPVLSNGSLLGTVHAPRGSDPQQPHSRDEVYIVARGNGEAVRGDARKKFQVTDLLFVPAGEIHRVENFTDDLT